MSNIQPKELSTALIKDGIIDFAQELYLVEKSASTNQDFPVTTNNYSTSSTSFTININSRDAIVDRNILLVQPLNLTINSSILQDNGILEQAQFAFRSFPLNSMINSVVLQMGNVSVTSQVGDMLPAFERVFTKDVFKYLDNGLSIVMPDIYKNVQLNNGASNNPYDQINGVGTDNSVPRGAWPVTLTGDNQTSVTVSTTLVEPLFISPLISSLRERCIGFTHLTSMILTINWNADPARMFSFFSSQPTGLPVFTSSLVFGPPKLNICQYVDPLILPPSVVSYPWNDAVRYTTDFTLPYTFGAKTFVQVASNTIQLDRIPKYALVYAMKNWNAFGFQDSRNFAAINQIQVNFNNVSYLNSCDQYSLYKYSIQNGNNQNFLSWGGNAMVDGDIKATVGPVAVLHFGTQIPLPSQWSVGTSVKVNLSMNVQFYNQNFSDEETSQPYTFYLALVFDSSVSLYGSNSGSANPACLTEVDVLRSQKEDPAIHYVEKNTHGFGSGLGHHSNYVASGKLAHHIKNIRTSHGPALKVASHYLKHGLKGAKSKGAREMADVMHAIGLGEGSGSDEGHGMSGGRKLSHSAMKSRLLR